MSYLARKFYIISDGSNSGRRWMQESFRTFCRKGWSGWGKKLNSSRQLPFMQQSWRWFRHVSAASNLNKAEILQINITKITIFSKKNYSNLIWLNHSHSKYIARIYHVIDLNCIESYPFSLMSWNSTNLLQNISIFDYFTFTR